MRLELAAHPPVATTSQPRATPAPLHSRARSAGCVARANTRRSVSTVEVGATKARPLRVIQLIAASVEANAIVARFEEFAGRSAMVGFSVALIVELLDAPVSRGLFGGLQGDEASLLGSAALAAITASACLAGASTRKLGARLTEAVLASLTAVQGSRSNDSTSRNVDRAVAFVMDDVFDSSLVNRHLVEDDPYL